MCHAVAKLRGQKVQGAEAINAAKQIKPTRPLGLPRSCTYVCADASASAEIKHMYKNKQTKRRHAHALLAGWVQVFVQAAVRAAATAPPRELDEHEPEHGWFQHLPENVPRATKPPTSSTSTDSVANVDVTPMHARG